MSYQSDIIQAAADSKEGARIIKEFAKGDATTQVDNGLPDGIPSIAKFLDEKNTEINEGGDSILAGAQLAQQGAETAEAGAQQILADTQAAVVTIGADAQLAAESAAQTTADLASVTTLAGQVSDDAAQTAADVVLADAAVAIVQSVALFQSTSALDSKAAQTTALPANTYANGTLGAGATLTANANGALTLATYFDGVTPAVGDTVLMRLEAAGRNWLFQFTQQGTGSLPWVFTRLPASDVSAEIGNAVTYVSAGTLFAGTKFRVDQAAGAIIVGTTALTFSQQAASVGAESALRFTGDAAERAHVDALLPANAPPGYAWSVLDSNDDAAVGVKDDGTLAAKAAEIEALVATTLNGSDVAAIALMIATLLFKSPPGYSWSVTDEDGDAAIGVKDDGTFAVSAIELQQLNAYPIAALTHDIDAAAQQFDAEINHVEGYGQSLKDGALATPAISLAQTKDSIMFAGGIRSAVTGDRSAFAPMVEASQETSMSGMCNMIKQLLLAENGIAYTDQTFQLLGSVAAQVGASIATLSKPGIYYDRVTADFTAGYTLSQAAGKSYKAGCLTWMQGEADIASALADYKSWALSLFTSIAADAVSISKRSDQLHVISYQIASHPVWAAQPNVARALLELAIENPWIHIAAPMYLFPLGSDEIHLTNTSEYWYGGYEGIAWKRIFIDKKPYSCLYPTAAVQQGRVIWVPFSGRVGNLVLGDTSLIALNTNNGIELVDSADSPLTISSMSVVNGKFLKIVAAAAPPAGSVLWFGRKTDRTGTFDGVHWLGVNGPINGPRVNLRDSQGDTITFNVNGTTRPMHNYCAIARVAIT